MRIGTLATAVPHSGVALQDELVRVEAELSLVGRDAGPVLREAISYHLSTGGKRLRPRMALLAGRVIGGDVSPDLVRFAAVTELVHAASLAHDDTLDEAATRRGIETVAPVGAAISPCWSAIICLPRRRSHGRPWQPAADGPAGGDHPVPGAGRACPAERRIPDRGQRGELRIAHCRQVGQPVCAGGRRRRRAGRCAARSRPGPCATTRYNLGLAFQIADDVLDYTAQRRKSWASPPGSDLKNGVVTLPALYYLESLAPDA